MVSGMHVLAALVAALVVCQLAIFLTTVYLHRTLSHRAMTLRPAAALPIRALLWVTTGIKPRQWVAVHRKHHAHTDVEGDPHSPVLLGFWPVELNNVGLYRRALKREDIVGRYAKDLPPDRWDRVLFDHGWLGLALGIALLYVVFGWQLALLAAAVHTVSYLYLSAMINAVGHTYGSRPYGGASTNNQWLAWLTAGEGLHNNHHAAPTSARFSLNRGERDPGWWAVRALRGARLATLRHDDAKVRLPTAA
jgi:stearoyl-CoA desaturase (delta-9 desaturase)